MSTNKQDIDDIVIEANAELAQEGAAIDWNDAPVTGSGEGFTQRATSTAEDRVAIYSTHTWEESIVPVYMLKTHMKQKWTLDNDVPSEYVGKPAWSLKQEGQPSRGTFKCVFHASSEARQDVLNAGLEGLTCNKSNIPTEFDVQRHASMKHPERYKALESFRRGRAEADSRDTMTELLKQLVDAKVTPKTKGSTK